ncbi:flagellar hook assembly protein FlgD [Aeromonas salmonicida]|uniref:flagellar hook assembly protein FlgD n=1 Tax=Aeromonas salmonicida TaxID=645 RepID=UPI003EC05639
MSLPQVSSLDTARSTSQRVATPDIAPNSAAAGQNPQGGMQLRNEFLQMMVAQIQIQIQNQDPTNPLDGAQYVTQLAKFSMVEGVESLKVLQQKSINMMDTQQVLQSTDLIDKEVMVPSKTLTQSAEKGIRGQIELAGAADQVELKVYDEHGTLVATKNWGDSKAGGLDYELPPLPAGEYSFAGRCFLNRCSLNGTN